MYASGTVAGRPARRRRLVAGAVVATLTAGLVALVPWVSGTTWTAVGRLFAGLDPRWLPWLAAVWVAGLVSYAVVQVAALPGLTVRRAVALNLAGSAVGNLVPLSGPAGLAVGGALARGWGFSMTRISAYLTVTTLWTTASRVVLGGGALVAWALTRPGRAELVGPAGTAALLGGLGVGLVVIAAPAASERLTGRLGALLGAALDRLDRWRGRPDRDVAGRLAAGARSTRRVAIERSRRCWGRFTVGLFGYTALLTLLLDGCLRAVGHPAPILLVCAAIGLERLVTAVPMTPGGAGVAELGLVGVLATTLDPAAATAGVLLYRVFTCALEVPTGVPVVLAHLARRRRAVTIPAQRQAPVRAGTVAVGAVAVGGAA